MITTASQTLELHGDSSKYIWDPNNGALSEIQKDLVQPFKSMPGMGNWSLELSEKSELQKLTPSEMLSLSIDKSSNQLKFTWRGIKNICNDSEVTVKWWIEDDLLTGLISYSGLPENVSVKKIIFPILLFEIRDNSELVLPTGLGCRIKGLDERENWEYTCKYKSDSTTMQFYAYLANGEGLYFSTKDSMGFIKDIEIRKFDEQTVKYSSGHLIPIDEVNQKKYEIPYPSCIGSFKGNWFDIAKIYQKWAVKQDWYISAKARKTAENAVDKIALWAWNRGRYDEVAPPLIKLQEMIDAPVALDWYWWHRNPYDAEYPRFLPPREGTDHFKSAIKELKEKEIFTQVYINGGMSDIDDPESWEKFGQQSRTISEDGSTPSTAFNPCKPNRLAGMCGEGKPFRQEIVRLAKEIHDLGLPGLYIDVVCNNRPCFHPEHNHKLGGGCYHMAGSKAMFHNVREQNPGMLLCAESCVEYFMGMLDSAIVLAPSWERLGVGDEKFYNFEHIPLFKAVYGNALTLFGNYALIDGIPPYDPLWPDAGIWKEEKNWRALCPDQFFIEIARTLVWGFQPTVANLRNEHIDNEEFKEEIEFLCNCAKFYYGNRDCLLSGQMLDPGYLSCEELEVSFLSRMIFTSPGKEEVRKKNLPSILHSRWTDANGDEILILANYTAVSQFFSWNCQEEKYSDQIAARSFMKVKLKKGSQK